MSIRLDSLKQLQSISDLKNGSDRRDYSIKKANDGDLYDQLYDFWENGEELPESSGVSVLNNHLKWKKGFVYCFTGYPGNGKSELLNFLSMKWAEAKQGRKVAMYSPESYPISSLAVSLIQIYTQRYLDPLKPHRESIPRDEWNRAVDYIGRTYSFLEMDEIPMSHHVLEVYESLISSGHQFFITDPFNSLADLSGNDMMSKNLQIALTRMKNFAVKHEVINTIVEHPKNWSGPIEDRPEVNPHLLFGGSMWNNKMDVIASIDRSKEPGSREVQVTVWKVKNQRIMGSPGSVTMLWDRGRYKSATIHELEEDRINAAIKENEYANFKNTGEIPF
jgi:hypothetical protein